MGDIRPFKKRVPRGEALAFYYANLMVVTDDCKIWPYYQSNGYGIVSIGGRQVPVHILACEAWNGPKPKDKPFALHGDCHNSLCWNGSHLYWGNDKMNQLDRARDGTSNRGKANGQNKLSEIEVQMIRDMAWNQGMTQRAIADEMLISQVTVQGILSGRIWGWLT